MAPRAPARCNAPEVSCQPALRHVSSSLEAALVTPERPSTRPRGVMAADEAAPPPVAALPFLCARLSARQLCVASAVCRDWRRAAAKELRRAMRLDNEADAGRAARALAAMQPQLEELSLVRACFSFSFSFCALRFAFLLAALGDRRRSRARGATAGVCARRDGR